MNSVIVVTSVVAVLGSAVASLPDGQTVMERVNGRSMGSDTRLALRLVLRDDRGEHVREIEMLRKGMRGGYRTLYTVKQPDHLAGVSLLIAEDAARGMWMYFPDSRHLMKIATRGLSALASDFSCEDLKVAYRAEDYAFKTLGREQIDGRSVLRVEMTPRSDRLAREVGYSRTIGWVQEGAWVVVRADYFDTDGQLFKTFDAAAPELRDGVWTIPRYRMTNHRARHLSEVTVVRSEYHLRLSESQFTPESLTIRGTARSGALRRLPRIAPEAEWP